MGGVLKITPQNWTSLMYAPIIMMIYKSFLKIVQKNNTVQWLKGVSRTDALAINHIQKIYHPYFH